MDVFEASGITPPAQNQVASAQPTQPADVFQAAGVSPPQGMQANAAPTGIFNATGEASKLPLSAAAGLAQYGHDLLNIPHDLAQSGLLVNPLITALLPKSVNQGLVNSIPSQPNYDFSQMLGVQNPGLADKAVQGAFHYAPYVAGALDSASPLVKGAMNMMRPQAAMDATLQNLSGGQSLEDNAKSLAQGLQSAFQKNFENGQALYDKVTNVVGDNSIYDNMPPGTSAYQNLDKDIFSSNKKLNNLHQQFTDNPTFNNAHTLQSQLGSGVRKLQDSYNKGELAPADWDTLDDYRDAQNAIKTDMNSYLENTNPALAQQYKDAGANWVKNVVPFSENPAISQIAKGEITNPSVSEIKNVFANPEPGMEQVINSMPPGSINKVLYNQLGQSSYKSPSSFLNAYNALDKQGIGSYVPPALDQQFDNLASALKGKSLATKGIAGAASAAGLYGLHQWTQHLFGGQ